LQVAANIGHFSTTLDASTPQRDRAAPRVREQPPSFGFRAT
jgi:hypothetical protein